MLKGKIYICIVAVTLHFYSFSQENEGVTRLVDKVENTSGEIEKLYLLDSLSKTIALIKSTDFDFYKKNYAKYVLQYIDLAQTLDSIDLAAFQTSKLTDHYLKVVRRPDSARIIVNTILKDSGKIKKKSNLGNLYASQGFVNFQIADLEKAIIDFRKAEKILSKTKDTLSTSKVIYYTGHTHQRLGDLTNAILRYQQVNDLFVQLRDTTYMAFNKINISYIFSQLSLFDEAMRARKEARSLLTSQKNPNNSALSQISVMDYRDLVKQKKYDDAETSLLKALEFSKKGSSYKSDMFTRAYLSVFYSKYKNQPEIARKYIDTIEQDADFRNGPDGQIVYLDIMAELEMARGRYKEAIPFLKQKREAFLKMNDVQSQLDVEECLYKSYKEINKLSEANAHLEKYMLLKDSLYNIKRSNSVIYYQTLYETEKRENKIAAQKASIEILEAKDEAKKNLMIFGGIGLSLLFLSIYLYRNRIFLMRNKKLQQSFLQELLQTQERVSKRISKDLHDSVGQSLLLIKNRVLKNKDDKTATVVDGVIDEVREISRTLHPFKLEELGLTVTLQSSVEKIDENYDIFISAEIDDIDKVFDQEREINIYRLVQESFNNILKHSNARSAEIIVRNKDQDIEIVIKDNGKGFDVSKEKMAASKIGLKTLAERSKFLKASFNILSEIDKGTTLIFNIPKHA
ncbi:tetratricopeptide repeat-containing sensor histidine kinase [Aquimarina mytili]|uniref:histidine kinase n=1 Tax=Aquimarina mytili TaxID=874423 RepID=A0A936ZR44_9FLAO|nr:sensor histidine kinase [Aquimarina mytili]MBL0684104.1 sensor histidine kinase [Aquimarina mytili]